MKKFSYSVAVFLLLIVAMASTAFAAANPINPPASSAAATAPGTPPAEYLQAINNMRNNKYNENDMKAFAYQVFSVFDRHPEFAQISVLFADDDLDMRLPETRIASQMDLEKWYAGIGTKYQSNLHVIERLSVSIPAKSDYRIDLVVQWQALAKDGKFTTQRMHQQWKVVDGGGYWPRITSYFVEPAL
jgi:hypothetical protein